MSIDVLHVDPDSAFLKTFAMQLSNENNVFNIISTQEMGDALDYIGSNQRTIECVVTECCFQNEDDLCILKSIRSEYPELPVIVFTEEERSTVDDDVLSAGTTDYLQKDGEKATYTLLATRIEAYAEQYQPDGTPNRIYQALETATEGIGLINDDGRYIYLNEAYAELYGYDRNELLGAHWEQLYPDDEARRFHKEILPELKKEGAWNGYSYGKRTTGERFPEKISLAQLEGDGHICVVRDISEQRRHQQQFETLADNLQGMVYRAKNSPEWPIKFAHGNVEDFLGYTVSELESQVLTWNEIIHPDDQDEVWDAVQEAIKGSERYEITYRVIDTDGDIKWVTDRGTGVETADGTVEAVDGLITNVTNQKEHKLELEWKTKAMDEAPVGIVISDPAQEDNPLIYVNNGFTELTKYSQEDILGQNCRFLQGPLTDTEPVREMRDAIDSQDTVETDILNYRENKIPFWNHVQISPITDADGELTHFVGFQTDITARVESERRIGVLNRVLRHNLRNNLNIVLGHLESLRENPDVADELITTIRSPIVELLETSQKARQIESRMDTVSFQPEQLQVEYVINSAITHGKSIDEDVEIITKVDSSHAVLAPEAITIAFKELVENAIRYAADAGPLIWITTESTTVSFQTEKADAVRIHIEDANSIIPDIDLARLLGDEESPVHHGTGLGLWLVNWIVVMSGGIIQHTEREDGGNKISITLVEATDPV